jgi:hypothetical protein
MELEFKNIVLSKTTYYFAPILQTFFPIQITINVSNFREILVGLSSGSIPDGSFVGELPNSYAIEDGCDHCWISEKTHKFEWPNGTTKPEWNSYGKRDVVGCGLVLNPAKELSLFFIGNGILMGQSFPFMTPIN